MTISQLKADTITPSDTNQQLDCQFIDSDEKLADFAENLASGMAIGIDTEFERSTTYYPKLCLVQISTAKSLYCLDTIFLENLPPLKTLLEDKNVTKIFFSAQQDLEVLNYHFGKPPQSIDDLQIAAAMLGHDLQTSYAKIIEHYFSVTLDKSNTRSDWTQRPLSSGQIRYAYDDVRYLLPLRDMLLETLAKKQRIEWYEEDRNQLISQNSSPPDANLLWRKVKGIGKISEQAQRYVPGLVEWREQRAQEKDRPRSWIIKDPVLCAIAASGASNASELKKIEGFPSRLPDTESEKILNVIHGEGEPVDMRRQMLSSSEKKQVKRLSEWVQSSADELAVPAQLLATRHNLIKLIQAPESENRLVTGWRKSVIGEKLLSLLT